MKLYEMIFVAKNELAEEQVNSIATSFSDFVKGHGGEIKFEHYFGTRSLAYEILTGVGCEVKTAENVAAATEVCKKEFKPDVLMTDVFLPDGEGSKVYDRLKKSHKNLKVVFLSGGEPGEKIQKTLLKDKYATFLAKPCRAEQVKETLQFLLAKA